jgi:hypothetical protein
VGPARTAGPCRGTDTHLLTMLDEVT